MKFKVTMTRENNETLVEVLPHQDTASNTGRVRSQSVVEPQTYVMRPGLPQRSTTSHNSPDSEWNGSFSPAKDKMEENLIDLDGTGFTSTSSNDTKEARGYSELPPYVGEDSSEICILLMGAAGTGKSSFIKRLTGQPVEIGNSLDPCTSDCKGWDLPYRPGVTVTLVDTPGFNDLEKPDIEILNSILQYIQKEARGRIAGIIYMHRITDKRITGSARLNLRMLQALCGDHFYQNVILTTTMWGTVPTNVVPDLESREAELNGLSVFWGDMLEKGSKYGRYDNTKLSGLKLVDMCLAQRNAPTLNIVLETRQGLSLEATSAGCILTEELRKREERRRRELREDQEDERRLLEQIKAEKELEIRGMQQSIREERENEDRRRLRHGVMPRPIEDSRSRHRRDDLAEHVYDEQLDDPSYEGDSGYVPRRRRNSRHGGNEKLRKFFSIGSGFR